MISVSCESELLEISEDETVTLTNDIYITGDFETIEKFDGVFDGNGYTIYNLDTCLIDTLSGEFKNTKFLDITFESKNSSIINYNAEGSITSITVENVTIEYVCSTSGENGTIVKFNEGEVKNCSVSDIVGESSFNIGGIVCENKKEGLIRGCHVENGYLNGNCVGGIVCENIGEVINCSSNNLEMNGGFVGGLIGKSIASTVKSCTVTDCRIEDALVSGGVIGEGKSHRNVTTSYLRGLEVKNTYVSGVKYSGGIMGSVHKYSEGSKLAVINCMIEVSDPGGIGVGFGEQGEKLSELYGENVTVKGKDVKLFKTGLTDSYITGTVIDTEGSPDLSTADDTDTFYTDLDTQTVSSDVVKASTQYDLQGIKPNDTVILKDDIVVTTTIEFPKHFNGTLQGNGFTISNLTGPVFDCVYGKIKNVTLKNMKNKSLADWTNGLLTKNLNGILKNVHITETELTDIRSTNFGFIAGEVYNGKITGCSVKDTEVIPKFNLEELPMKIGGIANNIFDNSLIQNCTTDVEVTAEAYGGIGHSITNGTVKECTSSGKITTSGNIGGITTKAEDVEILNSSSSISMDGYRTGGILCQSNRNCTIKNCTFKGNCTSEDGAGGICCWIGADAKIRKCSNFGDISSERVSGGIIAFSNGGMVKECINKGSVESQTCSGGIIAEQRCELTACVNKGAVTSEDRAGGITGNLHSGSLSKVYTDCTVSSPMRGPIIGNVFDDFEVDTLLHLYWKSSEKTDYEIVEFGTEVSAENNIELLLQI